MASQVEALYKYMTDNRLYNGSVNDFQRELSNPKTANSVFNYLSKNKLYTGNYESFASETNAYMETPATVDYSMLKSSVDKGLSSINTDIEKNPRTIKTLEETTYFAPSSPTTMINPFKTESREKEIEFKMRDDIKGMLSDAKKMLDQYEYNQSGKANYIKNVGKGAADALIDIDTWTFGMSELSKSATARAINKQIEEGKKYEDLSKIEQAYLDAMATNTAVAVFTEGKLGRGYTAGKTATESIPFMLSMFVNPAGGLGKILQGLATKKLASMTFKVGAKVLPKIASGTARVGGDLISSAVLANTVQAASTMADYQSRMLGTPTYTPTDEGDIRFNQFVGGEKDALTAFSKAEGAATIENFSEMAGMYLDAIPGFKQGIARLALGKGKNIKLISKIDDFIKVADKNNAVRTFNNLQDRVNWNGLFNEYAEELFGTAANATFVGDEKYSDLVDLDKQIDTFLSLSVTAGVMSGVQTGSFAYTGLKGTMMRNKAISRAKTQFEEPIWNSLRKDIDDAGVDNIGDELNKIFQRTDLNKDQKITALQYATGTAYAYGEDVAQEKKIYESLGFNNSERNITKKAAEIKISQELNKKANESTRTKEDFLIQEVELSDGRTGFVKKGNLTTDENNNIDFENSDKNIVVDIEGKLTPIAVNGSGLSVSKLLNSSSAKQEFANTLSAKYNQIDVMYDFPEGGNVYLIDPNTGQVMPDKGTILEFTDKGLKVKIAEPTGESEVEVPYAMVNLILTSDEKIKHQKENVYKKGDVIRGSGKVSVVIKEELDNGMYLIDTYDEDMNIIPQLSDQTLYGDEIRQALAIAPTEQAPTQGTEQAPTQGTEQAPNIQGMEENPAAQVPQQENEPDFDNLDEDSIVEFLSQEDNEVTTPFVEGRISKAISAAKKAEKLKIDTTTFSTAKQSAEIKKKTIELAEAERQKWSNIKAKLTEKKVVATAETLNKQKRDEVRKKTIASTNEKFALIQDKWQDTPKFEGVEYEFTLANNQKVSGRYILTEATAPTASHDPFNGYQKSEGFPVDENGNSVNDRDYEHEQQARQQVEQHAADYNSKAVENPVFVSKDGVVISGNDRTMASQIAAVNGTDTKYVEHITKYADRFGFTEEQVKSLKNPRIVFEVSEDLPYNANTFSMFNAEDKKTQNKTDKAVKYGKTISQGTFNKISAYIDSFESTSELYKNKEAVRDIINSLLQDKVILPNEVNVLMDGDAFSETGKSMFENMMLGAVLSEEAIRAVADLGLVRNNIISAIPQVLKNRLLGDDLNLTQEINDAVILLAEAKKQGVQYGENIWSIFKQMDIFGETAVAEATTQMLSNLMNTRETSSLKKALTTYNKESENTKAGIVDMFTGDTWNKNDILTKILNNFGYDTRTIEAAKANVTSSGNESRGVDSAQHQVDQTASTRTSDENVSEQIKEKHSIAQTVLDRLNIGVELIDSVDDPRIKDEKSALTAIQKGKNVKGWFNPNTGKAYIYVPNITNEKDAEETILHEVVSHFGLRELFKKAFGEEVKNNTPAYITEYNKFCEQIFSTLSIEDKRKYISYTLGVKDEGASSIQVTNALKSHKQRAAAGDEFLANIGEDINNIKPSILQQIIHLLQNVIEKIGFKYAKINNADISRLIKNKDVSGLLAASLTNLQKGTTTSTALQEEEETRFRIIDQNAPSPLRQKIQESANNIQQAQNDLLNTIFKKTGIDIRLEGGTRFRVVEVEKELAPRDRNRDREAFKKTFKKGGEAAYDFLYENQGGTIAKYPMEFLDFLKNIVGISDNVNDIVKDNHDWLVNKFIKDNPALFDAEESLVEIIPDVNELLAKKGFSLLEHTMDNGRALGVKFMYRDKFVEEGMADREYIPGYDYHGLSVICYYGNPEARLENQYVFTIEKDNAINTPTAYELAANPKLITPEWEAYLEREGRKNADGSYKLEDLTPNFNDPFSLSFLMVRINKQSPHGLEIISRYNHGAFTSGNDFKRINGQPNATLDLNLDNLVEGLTKSLYAHKNIEINEDEIRLSSNVRIASDNKLYQIKYERGGYYFGKGFYIDLNNKAHIINPAEEILVGQVLINKNGAIDVASNKHCFKDAHKIIISGNKVIIKHEGEEVIEKKGITLPNGTTKIVEKKVYKNEFTTEISVENNEVYFNSDVDKIDSLLNDTIDIMMINILSLPNVTTIGDDFLHDNESLKTIDLPNVKTIGNGFLFYNESLKTINLPNVTTIGKYFSHNNNSLKTIDLPNVTTIGNGFLLYNNSLKTIDLPNVETIGYDFLRNNESLKTINLPNVKTIGNCFLFYNNLLKTIDLPNVETIGNGFLHDNESLKTINLPNITTIEDYFLRNNKSLKTIDLPNVTTIGNSFLLYNNSLKTIDLPNVTTIGNSFLLYNNSLETIDLPNVTTIGNGFLLYNNSLKTINLPNVTTIENYFLRNNNSLKTINLPNVKTMGNGFLHENKNINKDEIIRTIEENNTIDRQEEETRFRIEEVPTYNPQRETFSNYLKELKEYNKNLNGAIESNVKEYRKHMAKNNSRSRKFYTYAVDKYRPIEHFQRGLKKLGATIRPETDAYYEKFLAKARKNWFSEQFDKNEYRDLLDKIRELVQGDFLDNTTIQINYVNQKGEDATREATKYEIVSAYLQAKDIVESLENEKDRGAKGFNSTYNISAQDFVQKIETAIGQDNVTDLWEKVNTCTNFAIDYLYKSGIITEENLNKMKERKYYVPQRDWATREFDEIDEGFITELSSYSSATIAAKGRSSLAANPIPYIQSIAQSAISYSEKNKTKQALLNLARENREIGIKNGMFSIKKTYYVNTGTKNENGDIIYDATYEIPSKELFEQDAETQSKINELKAQLKETRDTNERNSIKNEIKNLQEQLNVVTYINPSLIRNRTKEEVSETFVKVVENGETYLIQFKDAGLANAINDKFIQGEIPSAVMIASKGTRFLSSWMTQYNPTFAFYNFIRDSETAFISNSMEFGVVYAKDQIINIGKVAGTLTQYVKSGKIGENTKYGKLLKDFFEEGSATGWSYLKTVKELSTEAQKYINRSNVQNIASNLNPINITKIFGAMSEWSELSTRFAEYVTSIEHGYSSKEAAKHAKEVSVNFDRKGLIKWASPLFAFFNASIQGVNKFYRLQENSPKRKAQLTGICLSFFIGGIISTLLNPDDPDDERAWTEYDRMQNIVIGRFKIPLPQFLRGFWGCGVQIALALQGRKTGTQAMLDGLHYITGEILPEQLNITELVQIEEETGKAGLDFKRYLQNVTPTLAQPLVDILLNVDYRGLPVYKEPFVQSQKDKIPQTQLGKRGVNPAIQSFTNWMANVGGGSATAKTNRDISYFFDINPSKLEHLITGYTPGVGKFYSDLGALTYNLVTGKEINQSQIPIYNRMVKPYIEDKVQIKEWWSLKKKVDRFDYDINAYMKDKKNIKSRIKYEEYKRSELYKTYKKSKRMLNKLDPNKKSYQPSPDAIKQLIKLNNEWVENQ